MTPKVLCSITALLALASSAACGNCGPDMAARGTASATWTIARQPIQLAPSGGAGC